MEGEILLPWMAYREYFKVIKEKDCNNLEVKCLLCSSTSNKTYSVSRKTNSNLKKHLLSSHPSKIQELYGNIKRQRMSYKRLSTEYSNDATQHQQQQPFISSLWNMSSTSDSQSSISQESLDKMVIDLIVDIELPFTFVEEKTFQKLIQTAFPDLTLISRESLMHHIDYYTLNVQESIRNRLIIPTYVASTVDCWQHCNRTYFALTVHWIDPDSFERESAALAFQRIKRKLTVDVLIENILNVYNTYNILHKITRTTTDSSTNFEEKCRFSVNEIDATYEDHEDSNYSNPIDVTTLLDDLNEFNITYHRCISHTLLLILSQDIQQAEENLLYKKQLNSTFDYCKSIWKSQLTIVPAIKYKFGIDIKPPSCFKTTLDTLKTIHNLQKTNEHDLTQISAQFGVLDLIQTNAIFLEEYLNIMELFSRALDILQRDKSTFLGYVLPTIYTLQIKLGQIDRNALQFCSPLVMALLQGLNRRFGLFMLDKHLNLAAALHPMFKLYWIDDEFKKDEIKNWIKLEIELENAKLIKKEEIDVDDFFSFKTNLSSCVTSIDEVELFFTSVNDLPQLKFVPTIKKLFLKYNTGLPSSGVLTRLFGVSNEFFRQKSEKMSDEDFERVLLLKANGYSN